MAHRVSTFFASRPRHLPSMAILQTYRPETANWLAGRSPPSKADRASGVSPHEVAGYARTFKGRGPTLSDDDYRTRSWLRLGAGHRAGIQNPPAGRPTTADRRSVYYIGTFAKIIDTDCSIPDTN